MELSGKRLLCFHLPSADLYHAMIRVGDSAQMVVVAEWSDHRWVAAGSPGLCWWKVLSAWCGWPPSLCASSSPVLCLGLLGCPWKHCVQWHYSGLLPQLFYQACSVLWTERWGVSSSPQCRCGGCRRHTWCGIYTGLILAAVTDLPVWWSIPVSQAQQYHPLNARSPRGQNPKREIVRHHLTQKKTIQIR